MNTSDTIPFIAYLNWIFIEKLAKSDAFKSGEMEIAKGFNIPYFYHNEADTLSKLYCFLVVPKEVWENDEKYDELLGTTDERNTLNLFTYVKKREDSLKYALKSL